MSAKALAYRSSVSASSSSKELQNERPRMQDLIAMFFFKLDPKALVLKSRFEVDG